MLKQVEISVGPYPKGIHLITEQVVRAVGTFPGEGLINVFVRHTSAALSLGESADPDVRSDMAEFFDRLVPERETYYAHTAEGADDMPSHIKSVLCGAWVTVPVSGGRPALGTWQGIYLCEFRKHAGPRKIMVTVLGDWE